MVSWFQRVPMFQLFWHIETLKLFSRCKNIIVVQCSGLEYWNDETLKLETFLHGTIESSLLEC